MSPGKVAAQAVHAALGLASLDSSASDPLLSVVVLDSSDKKFEEAKVEHPTSAYVVRDAGRTEVQPGTETVMAFLEDYA